jgi:hypothetical protein
MYLYVCIYECRKIVRCVKRVGAQQLAEGGPSDARKTDEQTRQIFHVMKAHLLSKVINNKNNEQANKQDSF